MVKHLHQEGQQMQPNNKEQNNVAPVMDIQRPTQTSPSPQPRPTTVFTPSSQQTRPATMEYTRPRMDTNTTFDQSPQISQQDINMNKPKKSKKGLIISLFVLLFVGLSGAGAYYYMAVYKKAASQPQPQPQPVVETQPTETTTDSSTVPATPDGVDQTVEEIDQQLNSQNDTQDFPSNDVSDSNLGL